MSSLLIIWALVLIAATLLPLSNRREWYIRAMDFPRAQISVLALIWLLVFAMSESAPGTSGLITALCVVAVLVYQLYWIYPNTQLHDVEIERYLPQQGQAHDLVGTIRLLSSNVLMHNRNASALLALVHEHKPDVLITLESDQWWQDQLDTLTDYPHRIACPLDNLYGMHVYSRLPFLDSCIEYLVEDDKPSMKADVQLEGQQRIQLRIVHPAPPAPDENHESTERDVELLLIAQAVAASATPVIVAGDLNDVAWSATTRLFREISGLKDPRIGRGLFNTFNAQHWYIRWPLDHVFASHHFKLVNLRRLPDIGSDHYPLLVELAVTKDSKETSSTPAAPTEPELLDEIMNTRVAAQASKPS